MWSIVGVWWADCHTAMWWWNHRACLQMLRTMQWAIQWIRHMCLEIEYNGLTWQSLFTWSSILNAVPHRILLCKGIFTASGSPQWIWVLWKYLMHCLDAWIWCGWTWNTNFTYTKSYLDSEHTDGSNYIQRPTQNTIVTSCWVILPDCSRIFHGCNLGNVGHDIHISKINYVP